jgi:uncharacterized membrane protein (DUF485 family)
MSQAAGGERGRGQVDWVAAERSPEFRELIRRRRRFVVPAVVGFLVWYFLFIILAGYAKGFMSEQVTSGITVGYLLALTQFLMTWGLGAWYIRKSAREFDPLAHAAAQAALPRLSGQEPVAAGGAEEPVRRSRA